MDHWCVPWGSIKRSRAYASGHVCRGAFLILAWASLAVSASAQTKVFSSQSEVALVGLQENRQAIRGQVSALLRAVTGQQEETSAWLSLVSPKDNVGIKVAGHHPGDMRTHSAVVEAIVEGLLKAGLPRTNIIVWAGSAGFDKEAVFSAPILGELIWGDLLFRTQGEDKLSEISHLARELLSVDKIINVPVLCGSEGLGILGSIYNMTVPNIDNWRRFVQPPSLGDPYLCELYADPRVGPKVVLHLMDALVGQYAGGPKSQPNYAFEHRTLYASKDPVALDRVALAQVVHWREQAKLPALGPVTYLDTAEAMGLGEAPGKTEIKP